MLSVRLNLRARKKNSPHSTSRSSFFTVVARMQAGKGALPEHLVSNATEKWLALPPGSVFLQEFLQIGYVAKSSRSRLNDNYPSEILIIICIAVALKKPAPCCV